MAKTAKASMLRPGFASPMSAEDRGDRLDRLAHLDIQEETETQDCQVILETMAHLANLAKTDLPGRREMLVHPAQKESQDLKGLWDHRDQ